MRYYLVPPKMSYRAIHTHTNRINLTYIAKEVSSFTYATAWGYFMIPMTWYTGKGKSIGTIERVVARGWSGEWGDGRGSIEYAKHGGFLGQNYSVSLWPCKGGCVSLCICQNPLNCGTQRVKTNVNCGVWFKTYQYWLINFDKCTAGMQDVN